MKVNFGFGVAFIFLLLISLTSYQNTQLLVANDALVVHTHEVIEQINQTMSELKDLETGQRGFIITGNDDYLGPYNAALKDIDQHLGDLKRLTADNPDQQARIAKLTELKDRKVSELKRTIEMRRTEGFTATSNYIKGGVGKQIMDQARDVTAQIRAEENHLLDSRSERTNTSTKVTMAILLFGGSISLVIILVALFIVNRSETDRIRADNALKEQSQIREGLITLNDNMTGEQSISSLAKNVLQTIAAYIKASVGAIYLVGEHDTLKWAGGFAIPEGNRVPTEIKFGEGLVGQAAAQKKPIFVSDLPDHYLKVSSSLGEANPRSVYVLPFLHDDEVKGVSEFATLNPLTESQLEYLKLTLSNIGIAFNSAQARTRVAELLQETQSQAEELQVQQEELSSANEELEAQQEELRQANEELEEQRTTLEDNSKKMKQVNSSLEKTSREVEEKAKEVERASQYKSEFLANMSHELRTPLNSILLLSRALYDNVDGNLTNEQLEISKTVYSSGKDLLSLINDILDLSKVEAGKLDLKLHDTEVAELAQSMEHQFRRQMQDKRLSFEVKVAKDCPKTIFTDRLRLEQILKNFLSNAFKFTESGKVGLIFAPGRDQHLSISVTDTGIGIPADKQKQVFGAFEQLDSSASRRYGGTGLGLSIARQLAHLLGGEIHLESTAGKGSKFVLEIPVHSSAGLTAETQATPIKMSAPAKIDTEIRTRSRVLKDDRESLLPKDKTMLIVEDDPTFASILYKLCRDRGFKCLLAPDGELGLADAKNFSPSAIILDLRLPEMTGITVLENLKSNPRTRHIPVHVISVDERSSDVLKMGAVGFLSKPTTREEIDEAFRKLEDKLMTKARKVLIVEDRKIERESIQRLISDGDAKVVSTATGAEALDQLKNETFDCIVMDLHLPDMTGFQLLEKIGSDESISRPPVIIYTAKDLTSEELEKLRAFSESIIIKGVHSEERLLEEVTLFLHRVEAELPKEKQEILERLRHREEIFEKKKVLVVDDDMRNVFALRSILSQKGLEVFVAKTGKESLEKLVEHPDVDLILMDIMMPEMDGYEAMRQIRKQKKFAKLPILALTAKAMAADREKCLEAGASDYLSKPINTDNLFSLLRVWLTR